MCVDLLQQGHVLGFEEFFLASHEENPFYRPQKSENESTSGIIDLSADAKSSVRFREKPVLSDSAEIARKQLEELDEDGFTKRRLYRQSDLSHINRLWHSIEDAMETDNQHELFKRYAELGDLFLLIKDYASAITYFESSDRICSAIGSFEDQIDSLVHLGNALELNTVDNLEKAMESFEKSRKISQSYKERTKESETSKRLIKTRVQMAKSLDCDNQVQDAINHFMETLKIIQESCSDDVELIHSVHFELGKSYQHIGEFETAIKHLDSYLQYCRDVNNVALAGEAHATIASCYEKLGNHQAAVKHLEGFVKLAEERSDAISIIRANRQLGVLYNKLKKYDTSREYYQKYYQLGSQGAEMHSRCQIGISKGQANMGQFIRTVVSADKDSINLQKLTNWKTSYENFSSTLQ